jgi:hypothetical protein
MVLNEIMLAIFIAVEIFTENPVNRTHYGRLGKGIAKPKEQLQFSFEIL